MAERDRGERPVRRGYGDFNVFLLYLVESLDGYGYCHRPPQSIVITRLYLRAFGIVPVCPGHFRLYADEHSFAIRLYEVHNNPVDHVRKSFLCLVTRQMRNRSVTTISMRIADF